MPTQIYELMSKVMAEVGAVAKGRKNVQQGYAFRGIDDFYYAVQPALIKFGVFVCPAVVALAREERQTKSGSNLMYTILTVKHTFFAPDGSSVEAVTVGEAMDSGDKSANKAMSAAMKYALIEVFSIPTEEDNDTENASHDVRPKAATPNPATPAQVREVLDLLAVVKTPTSEVENWMRKAKARTWADFPADAIGKVIVHLKKKLPGNVAAA